MFLLLRLSTFISVKHMVVGWVRRVSTSMHCLLCLLVLGLLICLLMQHESRWRQVSFRLRGQRLNSSEMFFFFLGQGFYGVCQDITHIEIFMTCMIWTLVMHGASRNRLVHF